MIDELWKRGMVILHFFVVTWAVVPCPKRLRNHVVRLAIWDPWCCFVQSCLALGFFVQSFLINIPHKTFFCLFKFLLLWIAGYNWLKYFLFNLELWVVQPSTWFKVPHVLLWSGIEQTGLTVGYLTLRSRVYLQLTGVLQCDCCSPTLQSRARQQQKTTRCLFTLTSHVHPGYCIVSWLLCRHWCRPLYPR